MNGAGEDLRLIGEVPVIYALTPLNGAKTTQLANQRQGYNLIVPLVAPLFTDV